MHPASPEDRKKILALTLFCLALLVCLGLITRNAQLALFIALAVQMVGIFVIAPWKS